MPLRIDKTYITLREQWRYLCRAIDKYSEAVDFLLTADRDLDAARRYFRKMLRDQPLLAIVRNGTDGAGPYLPAIADSCKEGLLSCPFTTPSTALWPGSTTRPRL